MGKEGATMNLDVEPRTHPAWTGGNQNLLDRGGRVSRFAAKYGGFLKKQGFPAVSSRRAKGHTGRRSKGRRFLFAARGTCALFRICMRICFITGQARCVAFESGWT